LSLDKDKILLKLEMFIDVNKDWTNKFLHIYWVQAQLTEIKFTRPGSNLPDTRYTPNDSNGYFSYR
jgi:hypothetical protein